VKGGEKGKGKRRFGEREERGWMEGNGGNEGEHPQFFLLPGLI